MTDSRYIQFLPFEEILQVVNLPATVVKEYLAGTLPRFASSLPVLPVILDFTAKPKINR